MGKERGAMMIAVTGGSNIISNLKKIDFIALMWSMVSVLPVYLFRLFNMAIGIDTEIAIVDLNIEKNWLLGCGRFSRYIVKSVFGFLASDYYISTVASIIIMVVADYLILSNIRKHTNKFAFSFCILVLFSNPVFAEINYFTGDAFNYFLGIIIAMVSVYLASQAILFNCNRKRYIFAVLFGAIAVGFYQAYYYLLMAFVIMALILYLDNEQDHKSIINKIGKYILYGILVFVVYFILQKCIYILCYQPAWDYVGYESPEEYIRGTIMWNVFPVEECFNLIKNVIDSDINITGLFHMIPLYVLTTILIIYYIYAYIIHRNISSLMKLMLFVLLYGTYFLQIFISGGNVSARQKILPPFIICFLFIYILQMLVKRNMKICKGIICLIIVVISFSQALVSVKLFKTDAIRFEQDRDRAFEIQHELEQQYGTIEDKKIIFLGAWGNNLWETQLCGELIGNTIWIWDSYMEWGINYRVYYFMLANGIEYEKPTKDEIRKGIAWISENAVESSGPYVFVCDPQAEDIIYCLFN